jgi:hypothetical protein
VLANCTAKVDKLFCEFVNRRRPMNVDRLRGVAAQLAIGVARQHCRQSAWSAYVARRQDIVRPVFLIFAISRPAAQASSAHRAAQ